MDKYVGLDAHSQTCTFGVMSLAGKRLTSKVVETNGRALVDAVRNIPGDVHLCLEEGTQSAWLHEILSPEVAELVVSVPEKNLGPKDDLRDAWSRADDLRTGRVQTRVYKKRGAFGPLGELSRAHNALVTDSVRVQNRIKSLFRSRGVPCSRRQVYSPGKREEWLEKLPARSQPLAETF